MKKNITNKTHKKIYVLPGDGIGPEITKQAVKVLQKISNLYNHQFIFDYGLIGATAIDQTGSPLPQETLEKAKKSDAILFGAIGDPKYDNNPQAKVRPEQGLLKIRKELNLYANVRPIMLFDQLLDSSPLKKEIIKGTNIVFFRELIGGIYFGDRKEGKKTAYDICNYDYDSVARIAKLAFKSAMQRNKKLTSIDKANVLASSRLWRYTIDSLAKKYPQVTIEHMFVDNAAMQLIKNPRNFDVIVTSNMFGDILTDLSSQIVGSLGMLASASISDSIGLFEPIHGSAPKYTDLDVANPIATILSAAMLLDIGLNMKHESVSIINAVEKTLASGYRTKDIKTEDTKQDKIVGTSQMGDLICDNIK